jgi:hypothetical protein
VTQGGKMPQSNEDKPYAVMIPCAQEDFATFISGLLGKPQTIGRTYKQPFVVDRKDIENFYHLVEQRVKQQNEASLFNLSLGSSIQTTPQ